MRRTIALVTIDPRQQNILFMFLKYLDARLLVPKDSVTRPLDPTMQAIQEITNKKRRGHSDFFNSRALLEAGASFNTKYLGPSGLGRP